MSVLSRNWNLLNLGRFLLPRIESAACIHTTAQLDKNLNRQRAGPRKFMGYNTVIYKPQAQDEERRPAVNIIYILKTTAPICILFYRFFSVCL